MNFDYLIRELNSIKLGWENITKSPINNAISEHIEIQAKERVKELELAISVLEKAVILDDLFKDAIVVGEKVEVSK